MILDAILITISLALFLVGLWILWHATAAAWSDWKGGR